VKYYTNKARQAGMTLIELTVVLLVLVGLAGLLIPYVSGFIGKTHDSTGSSNIQAVNNAVQRYAVEHYDNFPNKLDSLIDGSTVYSKMMGELMTGSSFTPYLVPLTLDANQAKSFTDIGITTLKQMDATTNNGTFNNVSATDFAVEDTVVVAELDVTQFADSATLAEVMGKPVDTDHNHYVVFGMGEDSTIAGSTLSDVPVHFAQNADMGADKAYNHFTLVFEVPKGAYCELTAHMVGGNGTLDITLAAAEALALAADGTSAATCAADQATDMAASSDMLTYTWVDPTETKAKFIGSAMAMGMGNFEGLGGALNRFYKNTASN